MNLLPLFLLITALPLGIAAQNILSAIALLLMITLMFKSPDHRTQWAMLPLRQVGLTFAFVATIIVATLLNPANPHQNFAGELLGHINWVLLPGLCWMVYGNAIPQKEWDKLADWAMTIVMIWGGVALSQYLFDWRLSGSTLISGGRRAQGFYSHPLTLAYACLVTVPWSLHQFFSKPRHWRSWGFLGGTTALVVLSQSRTVQAVYLILFLFFCLASLQGRRRWLALSTCFMLAVSAMVIPNPFTWKFRQTFTEQGVDRHSPYRDDRLAFWKIHADMVRERPLLGHGADLDTAYRTPYYKSNGLDDFIKKYEAHNMYLQMAANGGLIALGIWILWLWGEISIIRRSLSQMALQRVLIATWAAYLVAGLTQNAFQDGEVRFAMTLLVGAAWLKRAP